MKEPAHITAGAEQLVKDNLDLLGVFHSPEAFGGPRIAQLDLTNNCNSDCIACWCHSPLLGEQRMRGSIKKQALPWQVVKHVIDDLADLGTEEILLAGSGEPLIYPNIMDALQRIQRRGIRCNLITNFTRVDEPLARMLVDLAVDTITASIWAGNARTYVKTHPAKTEKTLQQIERSLRRIHDQKSVLNRDHPKIKIVDVLMRPNVRDFEQMIEFALRTHADAVDFTFVDIIAGKTDCLRLSDDDYRFLAKALNRIRQREDYTELFCPDLAGSNLAKDHQREFTYFGHLIRVPARFNFDFSRLRLICPQGQIADRFDILHQAAAFDFKFNPQICGACADSHCGLNKSATTKRVDTLNLASCNALQRRILVQQGGCARRGPASGNIIETLPCYVGWIYSRILVNGDVVPCCKAHRVAMGNVLDHRFRQIWFSDKQREFRHKALTYEKSHPFFKKIDCYKACDNLAMNLDVHRRLVDLSGSEEQLLKQYNVRGSGS